MSGTDRAIIDLLIHAGALKRLPRQGWLHLDVPEPESVADHSFRTAFMTLLLAQGDPSINLERALVLALCHDLPEAIAGDATPFDEMLGEEEVDRDLLFNSSPAYSARADQAKRIAEEAALREMTSALPESLCTLIGDAWEEYEAGQTPEARLVRQVDKLEALLQAYEYRATMLDLRIDSFRLGALQRVQDDRLRQFLNAIVSYTSESGDESAG